VEEFRNLVAGWKETIGGYSVLVLDRKADDQPLKALLNAQQARAVTRQGPVVVLQRR
jgi:hypothetical protein